MKRKRTNFWLPALAAAGTAFAVMLLFFKSGSQRQPETDAVVYSEVTETKAAKETETEAIAEAETESETEESVPDTRAAAAASMKNLSAGEMAATGMIEQEFINSLFFAGAVQEDVYARINGKSYTENENIKLSELSYLKMLYYGFDGNTYVGEMIVNQKIESEVLEIFKTLYENQYPIERMVLVDTYDAEDELSMEANNTSAFNYRTISGSSRLSNHSYGMAIDLNPKYNPYVKTASDGTMICQPENGREYMDRSREFSYKIDENDLAYQLFTQAGFTWGGNWNSVKDYQHFEKEESF